VWIVVANLLATMNIEKFVDDQGKVREPTMELTNGLTSHPKVFRCLIRPRSEVAKELIERSR
jgi:hypothetical protein